MKLMKILGKKEKMSGNLMLKMTYYQLLSAMVDIWLVWKN